MNDLDLTIRKLQTKMQVQLLLLIDLRALFLPPKTKREKILLLVDLIDTISKLWLLDPKAPEETRYAVEDMIFYNIAKSS